MYEVILSMIKHREAIVAIVANRKVTHDKTWNEVA